MKTLHLNNQTQIPTLGLGTWELNGQTCIDAVKKAIDIGYRHIDTAEVYGNEEEVGSGIIESNIKREEIFLTSKAWFQNANYNTIINSCEESLNKLQTNYLDLYLLHWPDKNLNYPEIFKAFKQLLNQGKIKTFGLSNITINHLKELVPLAKEINLPITINQVEFHPLLYQKELLNYCNDQNIVVEAYSPLAKGHLLKNSVIAKIATYHNKSSSQVCLNWLFNKGLVVIPKASSENHLRENFNSFDFELSPQEIAMIDEINQNHRIVNPGFGEFDF